LAVPNSPTTTAPGDAVVSEGAVIDLEAALACPELASIGAVLDTPL
jgi:hypothetical protein